MAARGQRALATLPRMLKSLRGESISSAPRLTHLPSLRRTFSMYDQINLIDSVPEDQLRFQSFIKKLESFRCSSKKNQFALLPRGQIGQNARVTQMAKAGDLGLGTRLNYARYDDTGFKINNVKYEGSLLIVENKIMTWAPKTFAEITAESLSIFKAVRPIPEILILGCGRHIQPISPELRKFIRSTGMKLEAIDSRNATSTYNILNEEGRPVAAAVLPYGVTS